MKKILFITDDLNNFKIKTDSTYFLILTAIESNYHVFISTPNSIYSIDNNVYTRCSLLIGQQKSTAIPDMNSKWHELQQNDILNLNNFYAIFVRNDPPFNMEYYYLTQMLEIASNRFKIKIINSGSALRNCNEKLSILNFPTLITSTLVSKDYQAIYQFLEQHQDCVIKPIDMMAGIGVFKLSINDVNHHVILESSTKNFTQTVMIQKFIPEVKLGDKRIFIINDTIIDQCLCRIPSNNQIRGNLAAGGNGIVCPITSNDQNIAKQIIPWMRTNNIYYAGIDVIGNYLTEINITSPTGMRQIFDVSNINIPQIIINTISH